MGVRPGSELPDVPIVNKLAYIMFLKTIPDTGRLFDPIVVCSPEEATSAVICSWDANQTHWVLDETEKLICEEGNPIAYRARVIQSLVKRAEKLHESLMESYSRRIG